MPRISQYIFKKTKLKRSSFLGAPFINSRIFVGQSPIPEYVHFPLYSSGLFFFPVSLLRKEFLWSVPHPTFPHRLLKIKNSFFLQSAPLIPHNSSCFTTFVSVENMHHSSRGHFSKKLHARFDAYWREVEGFAKFLKHEERLFFIMGLVFSPHISIWGSISFSLSFGAFAPLILKLPLKTTHALPQKNPECWRIKGKEPKLARPHFLPPQVDE